MGTPTTRAIVCGRWGHRPLGPFVLCTTAQRLAKTAGQCSGSRRLSGEAYRSTEPGGRATLSPIREQKLTAPDFLITLLQNTVMALQPWRQATVTRIENITGNTRSFFLKVPGDDPFDFKPGQFITLDLPIDEKPNRRWRSYSIASWPETPLSTVTIKEYPFL